MFVAKRKLYTNPSFVIIFLNPCFSPLYLKVYSDIWSIFIVKASLVILKQNQTHKNTFYFYAFARNRAPIFYEWKVSILLQKSCSDFSNRTLILTASTNFNFSNFESLSQQTWTSICFVRWDTQF